MAKIIYANGETKEVQPKNGRDFSLAELTAIVGGYIEVTQTIKDGEIMIVNEEGKLLDLPYNPKATNIHKYHDVIVGDVLVCKYDEVR